MPDELTQTTFAPHVGSSFRVQVGDRALELTLAEVSDVRLSPRVEVFSLEFDGPAATPLPQAEYQFDHPVIGEFALFIVPVGCDGDVLHYEAVFNRLLPHQ
jgi:hypothetical protein